MSELQKHFEKWYREHHNIPITIAFTRKQNHYLEHEVQTAWSAFCEGFNVGVKWNSALNDFMECS